MTRNLKIGGPLVLAGLGALAVGAWAVGRARHGARGGTRAFHPINTLKSIGEDIWIVDGEPITAMGLTVPVRMTVIRLSDGTVLLHSPIRHAPALAQAIARLGRVRHLLAPTTAHWKYLGEWQRAFPGAVTWAVPGLRDRAQVRKSGIRLDHDLGDAAPAAWSGEIRQGLVRGLGLHEAWFFHEPSRTLVLTDLIENLDPARLPPVSAAAARLARATVARPALHVRTAILLGGQQAKGDIRTMVALAPDKVVFAHGAWFAANGATRLNRAFAWL